MVVDPVLTDNLIHFVDRAGVFVFGLSGGLVAVRHRMDLLGVLIVALFPAVGGGTVRDILLDLPVFWLSDPVSIGLPLLAGLFAFFWPHRFDELKFLIWADAIGISLFGVVGASKAYAINGDFAVTVMMGTVTACFGGLIRDVVCNDQPMLLSGERVYATAVIGGAATYWLARHFGFEEGASLALGAAVIFCIRAGGILFGLKLPRARGAHDA